MVAEDNVKEKISMQKYGDLMTDCSSSAFECGIAPLFLGFVGIPLMLRKLNKFVTLNGEIKVGLTILGAISIGIYTMKAVRLNCEEKVVAKYEV